MYDYCRDIAEAWLRRIAFTSPDHGNRPGTILGSKLVPKRFTALLFFLTDVLQSNDHLLICAGKMKAHDPGESNVPDRGSECLHNRI